MLRTVRAAADAERWSRQKKSASSLNAVECSIEAN
jgi:hypothetical protein